MKPELYFDQRSPPVRSVLLLIKTLGVDVDEKPIDLAKGEHLSETFIKVIWNEFNFWRHLIVWLISIFPCLFVCIFHVWQINPCHTVPVFCDSKVTLTDSHSILIYLCEQYGGKLGNQLWPSDPIDRINVLNKIFYSGTLLFRRDSDAIVSFCCCFFLQNHIKSWNIYTVLFSFFLDRVKLLCKNCEKIKWRCMLKRFVNNITFLRNIWRHINLWQQIL